MAYTSSLSNKLTTLPENRHFKVLNQAETAKRTLTLVTLEARPRSKTRLNSSLSTLSPSTSILNDLSKTKRASNAFSTINC